MLVRRERPGEAASVRTVVVSAFTHPAGREPVPAGVEPIEAGLLDRLRVDDGWLPALSLVAISLADAEVIGHVVCTRASVAGVPVLGLGPLSVRPDQQRRGVGSALVHAVLGAAEALDETLVGLLGSPDYYGRFGFVPASRYGIAAPDPAWGDYFQARPLAHGRPPTGSFAYARPFHDL